MSREPLMLITGGTGSLGVALVRRQVWSGVIRIFSRNEERQYSMRRRLLDEGLDPTRIEFIIGDCTDARAVRSALFGVSHVVHAAAMKDLIVCERQPSEAVRVNAYGTQVLLDELARAPWVHSTCVISTDKAAAPTSYYGASKLLMEGIVRESAPQIQGTICSARFGNMIDSSGSLIPEWVRGIPSDFALTHPEVSRFFFTTRDAADFVMKCLDVGSGGDVMIPRMKASSIMRILQLLEPNRDFPIVGLFPGEKLHEELLSDAEAPMAIDDGELIRLRDSRGRDGLGLRGGLTSNTTEQFSDEELRGLLERCRFVGR